MRTRDLLAVAGHVARTTPELWSLEAWGGATYDVALRFLNEDPWERLAALRQAVPNICLQMLLRGRNTVGYTPYPTAVTNAFVDEAADTGIDVFRIFDALNDVEQMRPAIEAVRGHGGSVAEVALCYTGDLSDPDEKLYTLDYYLALAERIVDAGAHVLAIKDMAGLLRAPAARTLVTALRDRFELPVHLHTHDTPGGQLATLVAAIESGVDAVDAACAAMAGTTSQPALSALVSATDHSERETGLSLAAVNALEPYWEATRRVYAPFESGLPSPTGRVYRARDPGRPAVQPAPAGDRAGARGEVRAGRGHVRRGQRHPRQRRQGDAVLQGGRRPGAAARRARRRPRRVRRGPRASSTSPPRSSASCTASSATRRAAGPSRSARRRSRGGSGRKPAEELSDEDAELLEGSSATRRTTLNRLLFPGPTKEYLEARERYGDVSVLPTLDYLYGLRQGEEREVVIEEGKTIILGVQAISDPDERGFRSVMALINGQLRPISVRDTSVSSEVVAAEKADTGKPGHVAAPFQGVVTVAVEEGATVSAGDTVATIEAMKMEASITAPVGGTVERLAVSGTRPSRAATWCWCSAEA